ncbi:MAG: RNA polymerase sigma-54 factor [Acidobacteria bacterium RIFCSPLOWO2_12_FULL_59_11]|nr:MAG: RNA polymerase sigma-54 factor [Acidobacteria bacterium RIFCSPLOWO2_12_FULL_59_11]
MSTLQPRLHLKVAQKQILTPGLVQMVSVLALNKLELREMIAQEITENPILEEVLDDETPSLEELAESEERGVSPADSEVLEAAGTADPFDEIDFGSFFEEYLDPGYRTPPAEVVELPSFENFLSSPTTLLDHLHWQLTMGHYAPKLEESIEVILGNLDENGYLTASLEELASGSSYPLQDLEEALRVVQECDPPGVAARDLRECLLIQLRVLGGEGTTAWKVVSAYLPQFQRKQYREIAKALGLSAAEVEESLVILKRLDPFPGQRYNKTEPRLIEPDVFIVKSGDDYTVAVNEDDLPQLRLNATYRRLLDHGNASKEVRNYVKERYTSALHLLKNIEQRKQTIVRVCQVIIRRQRDFLDYGVDYLKPMMIKEIAEEIGVHPSTVSRAVANKYAHIPHGVFELRYFFSEAVDGPVGNSVPLLILKRKVKKMIEQEDRNKPLTDDQLARILSSQGISVNRRTVAKYRADMKIPSTHQRRVHT